MVGCIIQARNSSSRLPFKVAKELPFGSGLSLLEQVIRRVKRSALVDKIIIATTTEVIDDSIVEISKKEDVNFFRGSKENLLERYYLAASQFQIDHIVRITSDCPCIDPEIITVCIREHIQNNADYTSNSYNNRFIRGMDMEVVKFNVLKEAYMKAENDFQKEHVTPYIYKDHSDLYKIHTVTAFDKFIDPTIRITVDTLEDYMLVGAVFDYLYNSNPYFGIKEITKLFADKPWLNYINSSVPHKKVFSSFEEEKTEAIKLLEYFGLERVKSWINSGSPI
ncbi:MAG: cytidylyltransferase domain-containing protein [Cytophagaceae bacterium]